MEVASPLTFTHVQAGSKRRFACSPILDTAVGVESNTDDYAMDDCNHYGHKKRRRFGPSDGFETNQSTTPSTINTFATPQTGTSHALLGKRQRNDDYPQDVTSTSTSSSAIFLQRVIEKQNAEIQNLRQEKVSMESTIRNMTENQEKMQHENKILKKAVTVQQQRQTHALTELEAARQYKEQAENKMRMLEQVINSLKYHLQAQQPHVGNDFIGLNPRPPDVF
mmetsp:Transcript_4510/g.6618  ORF Transcript_4510/g.6618 Transcript_4510/m.6618 type:complete len:223 (-) Transcript_4510:131-799(-)